jgi:hypothetical protein
MICSTGYERIIASTGIPAHGRGSLLSDNRCASSTTQDFKDTVRHTSVIAVACGYQLACVDARHATSRHLPLLATLPPDSNQIHVSVSDVRRDSLTPTDVLYADVVATRHIHERNDNVTD